MSSQCYLKKNTPELSIIGGIGEFAAHLPALPVPESIANQYDTEEMRALGWVVARHIDDDHGAAVSARHRHGAPSDEPTDNQIVGQPDGQTIEQTERLSPRDAA